mmetsp:Transcript_32451/g.52217  ORF Transcript_32451/g.52217 Transcript_32451/m.52217 type:complete len:210 (-) Transcript_32451:255-884(-)
MKKGTESGLLATFRKFDENGDGSIKQSELQKLLLTLGLDAKEVTTLFAQIDVNHDGKVSYEEFIQWMQGSSSVCESVKHFSLSEGAQELWGRILEVAAQSKAAGMEWMTSFKAFDADADGRLSLSEFCKGLEQLGVGFSQDEASLLFSTKDWSNDGSLDMHEFNELLEGKRCGPPDEAPLDAKVGTFQKQDGASHKTARQGTALLMEDF